MAQTYTLEEAAQRLGIAPEVMKRRLKEDWKTVRSFRDGPTLRFRGADIDELARSLGEQSDPSLQLAPLPEHVEPTSSQFELPPLEPPPKPAEEPLLFGGDDDLFALPVEEPAPAPKAKKTGDSDSDVRLDTKTKGDKASKSGRVKKPAPPPADDEEVPLDLAGPGSAVIRGGSAAKLTGSKTSTKLTASDSNKNLDAKNLGDSSEFELSLNADSDDFEIQMNPDAADDDEVALGSLPKRKGQKGGESGINLQNPADSGINLEKKPGPPSGIRPGAAGKLTGSSGKLGGAGGKPAPPESDLDFELSLEPPRSGPNLGGPRSGKLPPISHSDSEFELSLDDPSSAGDDDSLMSAALPDEDKKDIFETDFEIPPLDVGDDSSSSEAVALEGSDTDLESSDFDLALDSDDVVAEDESASQIVLLEDGSDEAAPARPTKGKGRHAAVADHDVELEEDEESEGVAGALKGVKGRPHFDEDEDDEEDEEGATPSSVAAPAPWGVVPALFLFPAFALMLLGGLMGYELVQSMWGYHQTRKPTTPIVRGVANMFELDVKDQ